MQSIGILRQLQATMSSVLGRNPTFESPGQNADRVIEVRMDRKMFKDSQVCLTVAQRFQHLTDQNSGVFRAGISSQAPIDKVQHANARSGKMKIPKFDRHSSLFQPSN